MKTSMQTRRREKKMPLALFHAPLPGEDVALFSDRNDDVREYEAIVHEFESVHDAEIEPGAWD